jgi:transposase
MMRPYGEGLKVYLYREPVDMRMWRNGLAALAQQVMKVDPFSGALLIFVGKRYNAVKIVSVWPWPMDRRLARGG